jgi:hypothetical protein
MAGPEEPRKTGIGTLVGAQSAGGRHNAGTGRAVARPARRPAAFAAKTSARALFMASAGLWMPMAFASIPEWLQSRRPGFLACRRSGRSAAVTSRVGSRNAHCLSAGVNPGLLSISNEPPFF